MVFSPTPSSLMNSCEPFFMPIKSLVPSMIEKGDSKQGNSQQISNFASKITGGFGGGKDPKTFPSRELLRDLVQ